jgi:hypothetical protein
MRKTRYRITKGGYKGSKLKVNKLDVATYMWTAKP